MTYQKTGLNLPSLQPPVGPGLVSMQPIRSRVPMTAADNTVKSKLDSNKEAEFNVFRHLLTWLILLILQLL